MKPSVAIDSKREKVQRQYMIHRTSTKMYDEYRKEILPMISQLVMLTRDFWDR